MGEKINSTNLEITRYALNFRENSYKLFLPIENGVKMIVCDRAGRSLKGKHEFEDNPFKCTLALCYLKKENLKKSIQSVSTETGVQMNETKSITVGVGLCIILNFENNDSYELRLITNTQMPSNAYFLHGAIDQNECGRRRRRADEPPRLSKRSDEIFFPEIYFPGSAAKPGYFKMTIRARQHTRHAQICIVKR